MKGTNKNVEQLNLYMTEKFKSEELFLLSSEQVLPPFKSTRTRLPVIYLLKQCWMYAHCVLCHLVYCDLSCSVYLPLFVLTCPSVTALTCPGVFCPDLSKCACHYLSSPIPVHPALTSPGVPALTCTHLSRCVLLSPVHSTCQHFPWTALTCPSGPWRCTCPHPNLVGICSNTL